ncbi:LysR family transcriptional regulator [Novipirellula caenicola]|uniref:Hydrogen peroxide-inducible genes activator n=1 Tax=Novipirellula caenicola TaxID=1536901 RepID=A0ABP9VWL3_9BACT
MEFDQLAHFLKIVQTQNITRAAEELGLSQPAVSRSLQRLEDEIGQPLFERQSRKMMLTDAGEVLASRARQIMSLIDDTLSEITDDGETGRIRVGAIPTIAPYFLPGLLQKFSTSFPKARMLVQEETTQSLLQRLTQGELDLAILALPIPAKYLEVEVLFEEELLLVMPTGHPLSQKRQIKLDDIQSLPFVLLDEAHCLSDNIVSFCRQRSFQPVSMEKTSQLAMVQELVSLGHGISMVPAMARAIDSNQQRLYRSFANPKPMRTIAAVWNPYRFQSRLLQAFHKAIQAYAAAFSAKA